MLLGDILMEGLKSGWWIHASDIGDLTVDYVKKQSKQKWFGEHRYKPNGFWVTPEGQWLRFAHGNRNMPYVYRVKVEEDDGMEIKILESPHEVPKIEDTSLPDWSAYMADENPGAIYFPHPQNWNISIDVPSMVIIKPAMITKIHLWKKMPVEPVIRRHTKYSTQSGWNVREFPLHPR